MKAFFIWLLTAILILGSTATSYHFILKNNPRKVLVIVDSSFHMKPIWHKIPQSLQTIGKQRYTVFSLVTEKGKIHDWKPELTLSKMTPYAPREFTRLIGQGRYNEIDEAEEVYLVTNAKTQETNKFSGWKIIRFD